MGASNYSWLNYSDEQFMEFYANRNRTILGTALHEFASNRIKRAKRLPKRIAIVRDLAESYMEGNYKWDVISCVRNLPEEVIMSLIAFVNDALNFHMQSEQVLYFSDNCFGTSDAVSFQDDVLRIHDYKSGRVPGHMDQLLIYSALFCLQYHKSPEKIKTELRIYQSGDVTVYEPAFDEIATIMELIKHFDAYANTLHREGM